MTYLHGEYFDLEAGAWFAVRRLAPSLEGNSDNGYGMEDPVPYPHPYGSGLSFRFIPQPSYSEGDGRTDGTTPLSQAVGGRGHNLRRSWSFTGHELADSVPPEPAIFINGTDEENTRRRLKRGRLSTHFSSFHYKKFSCIASRCSEYLLCTPVTLFVKPGALPASCALKEPYRIIDPNTP